MLHPYGWSLEVNVLCEWVIGLSVVFVACVFKFCVEFWCDFDRASSLMCGNKMPARCNRGFYCRSYCLLNMFRGTLCPSSETQEYYTVVAACGISCCGFQAPPTREHVTPLRAVPYPVPSPSRQTDSRTIPKWPEPSFSTDLQPPTPHTPQNRNSKPASILQTGHITLSSAPDQQLENHSTKYHRQQPPV